jgi:hypothetical protein
MDGASVWILNFAYKVIVCRRIIASGMAEGIGMPKGFRWISKENTDTNSTSLAVQSGPAWEGVHVLHGAIFHTGTRSAPGYLEILNLRFNGSNGAWLIGFDGSNSFRILAALPGLSS